MTLADYLAPTDAQRAAAWVRDYRSGHCWYCRRGPGTALHLPLPNGHYACVKCLQLTTK